MSATMLPSLLPLKDGEQYRFVFDMNACVGCHSCEVACAEQNNLPVEVAWRKVGEIEGGEFPATKRFNLSMACNHCLEPTCLEGCPTEAYVKLSNGVVQHHAEDCIGCQYCTWNCPYSVPVFHAARKIVSKCDMCLPRLEGGYTSACVDACPTNAIGIEIVNKDTWRADHSAANAPNLPSSDITLSTTRIVLPVDMDVETFAANDYNVRPEHPHWPLAITTLLMQLAMGTVLALAIGTLSRATTVTAFAAAAISLPVSLFHLGRPILAWKAIRGIRRSWLSREVVAFAVFAGVCLGLVALPWRATAILAALVGLVAVGCSGRLYVVRGRPAWDTPLTIVSFVLSGVAAGPLMAMSVGGTSGVLRALSAIGTVGQLATLAANALRLRRGAAREWVGSYRLLTETFRSLLIVRVSLALVGLAFAVAGSPLVGVVAVGIGELVGRYLFYVTVVPLSSPGTFGAGSR
jgi:formate dehydrogenase iron-sulfur subunit